MLDGWVLSLVSRRFGVSGSGFETSLSHSRQGQANPNAALRWREIRLIGGLVLPVWDVVVRALSSQKRAVDRRLHVVRILLTGPPFSMA